LGFEVTPHQFESLLLDFELLLEDLDLLLLSLCRSARGVV
jgi:hypothetical protein